ncbi:DUF11 domain-containing protein [Methanobrevibacter sp.]
MKYRYLFALILIITTLFLIGSTSAIEDADFNATASDEGQISLDSYVNPEVEESLNSPSDIETEMLTAENCDLSVDAELGDIKKTTFGINEISFDVPLIITAKATGGTAKDVKVHLIIPDEFEFVSYDTDIGFYSSATGIWNIGDLDDHAKLTIFTKINQKGKYLISANSTTTSDDADLTNNYIGCNIEVTSKISSNVTRTSADRSAPQHTSHYASTAKGAYRGYSGEDIPKPDKTDPQQPINEETDPNKNEETDPGTNEESYPNKNEETGGNEQGGQTNNNNNGAGQGSTQQGGSGSSNVLKKGISTSLVSNVFNSLSNTISNILNPDSTPNLDRYSPSRIFKAIQANNYTIIPIMIFALFLVMMAGSYAYEKIRH